MEPINKYGTWGLVIGASSGIGQDLCRRLAQRALNLVLVVDRIVNSLGTSGLPVPDPFGKFLRMVSAWMGRSFASSVIGREMKKMSNS